MLQMRRHANVENGCALMASSPVPTLLVSLSNADAGRLVAALATIRTVAAPTSPFARLLTSLRMASVFLIFPLISFHVDRWH